MARTAIQLYTLRDADAPLADLLREIADAGYDGVEFAEPVPDDERDAVREALDRTGLDVVGSHVGIDLVESDPGSLADTLGTFGCDRVVVPWLDPEHFATQPATYRAAVRLSEASAALAEHGLDLLYHNHTQEFADVGATSAYGLLVPATVGVGYELDLGWAAAGGYDPAAILRRFGPHVPLVHAADVDGAGASAELGAGVVDLPACVEAALDAGCEWFVYEHDEPDDPLESMRHGSEELDRLLA
ncbi:sugar phosphate isomerase/epimerase family protein [Halomarina pelagica]|uniref:sugar phosphate isomerase/epimerase family protein n=1 Tax=Halomarina pelagica TaxID=2961599 RepID=UPI0020C4A428|nr:sugar phosphate isomerase/epimerase [Halomarina sp. BND7]